MQCIVQCDIYPYKVRTCCTVLAYIDLHTFLMRSTVLRTGTLLRKDMLYPTYCSILSNNKEGSQIGTLQHYEFSWRTLPPNLSENERVPCMKRRQNWNFRSSIGHSKEDPSSYFPRFLLHQRGGREKASSSHLLQTSPPLTMLAPPPPPPPPLLDLPPYLVVGSTIVLGTYYYFSIPLSQPTLRDVWYEYFASLVSSLASNAITIHSWKQRRMRAKEEILVVVCTRTRTWVWG